MVYLVFLNEARAGSRAGGTDVFSSVEAVANYVEAIDAANGEYNCFTSTGEAIVFRLSPHRGYPNEIQLAKVSATCSPAPEQLQNYQSIVYDYLTKICADNSFNIPPTISAQTELSTLASFVPKDYITA